MLEARTWRVDEAGTSVNPGANACCEKTSAKECAARDIAIAGAEAPTP